MVGTSVRKVTRRLMPWLHAGYVSMFRNVSGNGTQPRLRATQAAIRSPYNVLIFRSIGDNKRKRDGCCNHLVSFVSKVFSLLPLRSAVRRGFYPNPRNTPSIKWLHALPNEAGYTLVTRFHTSKSASLNALSMNLYTANVTSFSGTCK